MTDHNEPRLLALEARVADLERAAKPRGVELTLAARPSYIEVALERDGRRNVIRVPRERFGELRRLMEEAESR